MFSVSIAFTHIFNFFFLSLDMNLFPWMHTSPICSFFIKGRVRIENVWFLLDTFENLQWVIPLFKYPDSLFRCCRKSTYKIVCTNWNEQWGDILEFNLLRNYRALSIYYLWLKLNHMWFDWHTKCSHMIDGETEMAHAHTVHTHTSECATYGDPIMEKVIISVTCRLWPRRQWIAIAQNVYVWDMGRKRPTTSLQINASEFCESTKSSHTRAGSPSHQGIHYEATNLYLRWWLIPSLRLHMFIHIILPSKIVYLI